MAGNEGGFGPFASASFEIDLESPTQTSPPNGAQLEFPTQPSAFTWTPLPGAREYVLQWADNPEFIGNGEIKSATNGAILVGTTPFGEEYYWRVQADYGGGIRSNWSPSGTFTVVWPDEPGKGRPTLVSPPNTTPLTKVTDVEMVWEPVIGARSYQLQVSLNQDFAGGSVLDGIVYSTRYSPPETFDNGSYFWRVRPIDANNNAGPWSGAFRFTRAWPIDPFDANGEEGIPGVSNPPVLVAPANGANLTNDPMTFDWEPIDRASEYQLQVSSDQNFTQNVRSCTTVHTKIIEGSRRLAGPGEPSCQTEVFRDSNGSFPGSTGTLYWRVRGIDEPAGVLGLWSTSRSYSKTSATCAVSCGGFVTNNPVTYVAPADCPPNDVCQNLTSVPEFRWDPYPGAGSYLVTVALDAQFTNVFAVYSVAQPYNSGGAPVQPVFYPTREWPDNDAGQAYYWHVQPCSGPYDNQNNQPPCSLGPQGQPDPPRFAFQKRSEAVETTGPGIIYDPGNPNAPKPVVTSTPRLEWEDYLSTTTNDLEARRYQVQVAGDAVFSEVYEDIEVDQPFYTLYNDTYPEGPLYWRVRASDGSDNDLTWSATRALDYQSVPPTLLAPANNANVTGTPQFSWQTIAYAEDYQFELYKNGNDPIGPGNRIDNRTTMFGDFTPYLDLPVGTYAWRVRRDDGRGRDGPWSPTRKFTITSVAPQLTQPPNGTTFEDNEIVYTWSPLNGAVTYRFERSATSDFSSIVETQVTVMPSWATTKDYANGTWYWRVTALDKSNQSMGTSVTRTVIKDQRDLPSVPRNVSVTNAAGGFTLRWSPPASPGVPAYNQYVIVVSGGSLPAAIQRVVGPLTTQTTFNGLTNGDLFNVSLRAKSTEGDGDVVGVQATPNGCADTPFADVSNTSIFCNQIGWLYGEGITEGVELPDDSVLYQPANPVSRQAMAKFLFTYLGDPGFVPPATPTFTDMPKTSIFYQSVEWLAASGITGGCGGTSFCPTAPVSRQSMAAFLYRAAGEPVFIPAGQTFDDVPPTSIFYKQVEWLANTGITGGCNAGGTLFCPGTSVSRQQMAAFLFAYDQLFGPGVGTGGPTPLT